MKFKSKIFLLMTTFLTLNISQVKAESKNTAISAANGTALIENKVSKINYLKIEGIETSSNQKCFEDYLQINICSNYLNNY